MKRKKLLPALLVGVLCAGLLAGCASDRAETVSSEEPSAAQPSVEPSPEPSDEPVDEGSAFSLGEFTTQDINGNAYTQEMFADYDLTLVNIFATWCSPCVAEMPELEELHQELKDRGVNVVGFVLDAVDDTGEVIPESLGQAQKLVEETGVTYPVLLPDPGFLNGRLQGIMAVPETFFVDKNGNEVGGVYRGSGSFEDWLAVVEEELAALEDGAS